MLKLNLNPVFKLKGIEKPFSYLVKCGFNNHTAHYLLSNSVRSIRLDHIEKLCLLLKCSPNDILTWIPGSTDIDYESMPLNKLRSNNANILDLKNTLMNLPFETLKSLSEKINNEFTKDNLNQVDDN